MYTLGKRIKTRLKESIAETHRLVTEIKRSAEELEKTRNKIKKDRSLKNDQSTWIKSHILPEDQKE